MEYPELVKFRDGVSAIEQFFVEMAANEDQLLTFGYKRAFELPTANPAFSALTTFNEDFSLVRRFMLQMDRAFAEELQQIDSEGKVVEQVSLIALKLRMERAREPITVRLAAMNQVLMYVPYVSRRVRSKGLFGEAPVSLQRTIIYLQRLKGLISTFSEHMANRRTLDDEVFKPSNVRPERVASLIDQALIDLEHSTYLSPEQVERVRGYLFEAKREAASSNPSWHKIVGALVVVAAITSGIADAQNAFKNIKDAIDYILGTSVQVERHRLELPSPKHESVPEPPRNVA